MRQAIDVSWENERRAPKTPSLLGSEHEAGGNVRLFIPSDIETAYEEWGANCGPCALAAIVGKKLSEVHPHLAEFAKRKYMNPTHIKNALESMGIAFRSLGAHFPQNGLAFVQWSGFEKRPVFVQYQHTHWIAVKDGQYFEINTPPGDNWVSPALWERVMPAFIAEHIKGATGSYFVRTGIEIQKIVC